VLVEAVEVHPFLGVDLSEAQVAAIDEAETNLRKAAKRLNDEGITAEPHTYYDKPVPAILDAAGRHHADLIVMSTHGRSGVGRVVYGSVTDHVLHRASVPVLVVPAIVDQAWSSDRQLSVLVTLDGSELAEEALEAVETLIAPGETKLTLLRVVEPPTYPVYGDGYAYVPYDEEAEVTAAEQYLGRQAGLLRERGWQVQGKVTAGYPASAIASIAREQHVDLVAMATHGHGGLSRLLLGSTATSVLRQTTVPLLLTRPAALHRAEPMSEPISASRTIASTASWTAAETGDTSIPTIDVRLSEFDLELIEHGLKALAQAPGYDYGQILAAQALARRLEASATAETGEPMAAR